METAELESKVYLALKTSAEITGLLAEGENSIYHMLAPSGDGQQYPILVYSTISDVPSTYGDNEEKSHRITIRIHIITEDGEYTEIYKEVNQIMIGLEFNRVQTTPYFEQDKKMLIVDYRIVIEA